MRFLVFILSLGLAGCATELKHTQGDLLPSVSFQSKALSPSNGGRLVSGSDLRPGDIVLTASNGIASTGIRLMTLAPVSHAALYVGDQQVIEAVGDGIRRRSIDDLMKEELTVVAFRHPNIEAEHAQRIHAFAHEHVGRSYNFLGVILQSPFAIERRLCELPLIPSLVRDFCIRGVAAIQLGLGRSDQFFCSQFVLEAYRRAGLALTDADSRLISPGDLLHMREGDVPSVRVHKPLNYVGHVKSDLALQAAN